MAYLQFEAMGIPKVRTKLSVSYVDHNMLQAGFENFDDHLFLQSIAEKYGMYFSKPGNGICHQVHLERFAVPGETLLGSDSHTPTCGGLGMIAIGAGGLDVAIAMAGGPFYISMPKVVLVKLSGTLQPWVTAKDVILELLRRVTVKGGVGKVFEYGGDGVKTLTLTERATITNMGAELGALTSNLQGGKTVLKSLQQPPSTFASPLEMFTKTLDHEQFITRSINDLMELAMAEKDHASPIFLQWYETEQVEEESNDNEIIAQLVIIRDDPNGLMMLDRELAGRIATVPTEFSKGLQAAL